MGEHHGRAAGKTGGPWVMLGLTSRLHIHCCSQEMQTNGSRTRNLRCQPGLDLVCNTDTDTDTDTDIDTDTDTDTDTNTNTNTM